MDETRRKEAHAFSNENVGSLSKMGSQWCAHLEPRPHRAGLLNYGNVISFTFEDNEWTNYYWLLLSEVKLI